MRMTFKYVPNPKSNNLQWMCAWVTLWLIGVRTVGLFAEKMQCLILSWAIWVSCDKYNIDVDYCPVDSGCKCALCVFVQFLAEQNSIEEFYRAKVRGRVKVRVSLLVLLSGS